MKDPGISVRRQKPLDEGSVQQVSLNEFGASEGINVALGEIVHNGQIKSPVKRVPSKVRADVTRSADNQNAFTWQYATSLYRLAFKEITGAEGFFE